MIFWLILSLLVQGYILFLVWVDFPKDSLIVALAISLAVSTGIIIASLRKAWRHRVEKLENHRRRLLAEIDELKEQLARKRED